MDQFTQLPQLTHHGTPLKLTNPGTEPTMAKPLVNGPPPPQMAQPSLLEPPLRLTAILLPSHLMTPHGLTLQVPHPLPLTARLSTNGLPQPPTALVLLSLSLTEPPPCQARLTPSHLQAPVSPPCHPLTPGPPLSGDPLSRNGLHPVSPTEPPPILMALSPPLTPHHHHGPHLPPTLPP